MALSEDRILDAAIDVLNAYGLASTSMRQIAKEIGVQPNSIYWYIKSKQELLAKIAERIITADEDAPRDPGNNDADQEIANILRQLRKNMLSVRDGAEIVSLAQALQPTPLKPIQQITVILHRTLDQRSANWGARALVHYALGLVAEEQNHQELLRAGIVTADESSLQTAEEFDFGISTILTGLALPSPSTPAELA